MKTPTYEYMTVDPGLTGSGWIFWQGQRILGHGVIKSPRPRDSYWVHRAFDVADMLCIAADQCKPMEIICEEPKFMGSSARGRASAGSGSLVRLSMMVGILMAKLDPMIEFTLLDVNDWKGNMDKDAVAKRVRRIMGDAAEDLKDHELDAAGMGLHYQGRF